MSTDDEESEPRVSLPDFEDLDPAHRERLASLIEQGFVSMPGFIENAIDQKFLELDALLRQQSRNQRAQSETVEEETEG